MNSKTLLHSILFTSLVAAAPLAFAQDATTGADARATAEAAAQAGVRADQLAAHYAEVAGSTEAAAALVQQLQAGAAGTGAMAYGEIDTALAMSAALVESGAASSFDAAVDTVVGLRAEGMGWGRVAQDLGINVGAAVSAAHRADIASQVVGSAAVGTSVASQARAGAETTADAVVGAATGIANGVRADVERGAAADARVNADVRVDAGVRATTPDRPVRADGGATIGIGVGGAPTRPVLPERPARGGLL